MWEMLVPPYITFYMENKLLTIFEVLINIVALALYFHSYKKVKYVTLLSIFKIKFMSTLLTLAIMKNSWVNLNPYELQ